MATTIKKISELEQITELSSSSNVIIEENGKAKRIAANNFAVGGSSEQVQADLSQNDPTAPDYVKNRTHYEEGSQTVIEWDGNTEGRESVTMGETAYKISDLTPSVDELVGAILTMSNGETLTIADSDVMEPIPGLVVFATANVIVALSEEVTDHSGTTLTFPSTGVYAGSGEMYVSKLTYGSTTIHQLDEKFIPESIARTSDIPEVNYPVTSVNGMTGDVVIEGGTGGSSGSWNDLTDKPFGEEISVTETEILPEYKVYFSNMASSGGPVNAGMRSGIPFTGTVADGDRCIITVSCDYESGAIYNGTYECTAYTANNQVLVGDKYYWMDCSGEHTAEVPFCLCPAAKTGVGIMGSSFTIRIVKVEEGVTINKLDEKFIPESIARTSDIPEVNYPVTSVNGMTGDVVIEAGSGSGSSVQPDWNQNDETAADYVKNRTHWTEDGFAIAITERVVHFEASETVKPAIIDNADNSIILSADVECKVVWNNIQYTSSSGYGSMVSAATGDGIGVGNSALATDPNADGLPFYIVKKANAVYVYRNGTAAADAAFVLYQYGTTYSAINEKYIPDAIARCADTISAEYEEHTITWDGNRSGKDSMYIDSTMYYKVSDCIPSDARAIKVLSNTGDTYSTVVTIGDGALVYGHRHQGIVVVYKTTFSLNCKAYTAPSTGVYFYYGARSYYMASLIYRTKKVPAACLPKLSAISDLTAAPTMEDFNNLLAVLRDAGYLATE